tara:strand:+ start:192 stop:593 length:402 start_codon:yes stop_codon:yes gene_type:complete
MGVYTSKELNGTGSLFTDQLNAGQTGTFTFNVVGSDAIESLSGSAYFTMEKQTNGRNEYADNVEFLSGKFENVTNDENMEDLGFISGSYRWSINVGNTLDNPRVTWIPDFDVTDQPVMVRATGGINLSVAITP